jgi:citrate synthase
VCNNNKLGFFTVFAYIVCKAVNVVIVKRRLYPNVDFYSGLIYEALRFPPEMFTVLFAVPRTAGWAAQWLEGITDPEQKITRPRQVYTGHRGRPYVPADQR